jgi:hypothetical protein
MKCAISSAEQHIVHAPQDFPGAAVIRSLALPPKPGESWRAESHPYHRSAAKREADLQVRIGPAALGALGGSPHRPPQHQRPAGKRRGRP